MRKFTKVIFAASIGIASIAAVLIQPTPAAAAQIGEDMGKCTQKAHFKDKMCACKDSSCAQKVHSPATAKKGSVGSGAGKAGAANGLRNSKKQ